MTRPTLIILRFLDVRQRFCYRLRKKRVSHKDERVQNITCLAIKIKKKTLRGEK